MCDGGGGKLCAASLHTDKGTIDADLLCKRLHLHSGHRENNVTLASGYSSVIIEGGYLCSANAASHTDIWLEEVQMSSVLRQHARH